LPTIFPQFRKNGKKHPLQGMTNAAFHSRKKKMAKNTKTDSK
jgi:hypothetical protein